MQNNIIERCLELTRSDKIVVKNTYAYKTRKYTQTKTKQTTICIFPWKKISWIVF